MGVVTDMDRPVNDSRAAGADLKVAVVGCGQIADAHLQEIARVPGARTVAVCDINRDVASQAAARFGNPAVFDDLDEMLRIAVPDVVHITIPAHVRSNVVRRCLAAGAHAYVEKPVAMNASELEELYREADRFGRILCAGHDQLFDPAWMDVRGLFRSGAIGDVVHVDAVQGYDLSGPFGRVIQQDGGHWVRNLPGGLFQNIISHALARICDLLPDDTDVVSATWSVRHVANMPTELRVLCASSRASAALTFSSAARPVRRTATIYGTRATLDVDLDARMVRVSRPTSSPTGLLKLYLPAAALRDGWRALRLNLKRARAGDLGYFLGMRAIFRELYAAIREGREGPVTAHEALRVTRLMDRIIQDAREREHRLSVTCASSIEEPAAMAF